MQQVIVQQSSYPEHFRARRKERLGEPVWFIERRQAAMDAFEAAGFPSRRQEAWRNIDLSALTQRDFPTVHFTGEADREVEAIAQVLPEAHRLVFVDGHFSERHSRLPQVKGLTVRPLHQRWETDEALLGEQLGALAATADHAFAALNTAFFEDGALVHVARGVVVEQPVLLVFVSSAEAAEHAVYPRTLVVAEEGAQVQLVEFHQGPDQVYLSAPVTEIVVGANAGVQHHKVQEEGAGGLHLGVIAARLARDARLYLHSFAKGGKLARTDITVELAEPGAEATLDGLYLTRDGQYSDHHTLVHHQVEHCNSHQRFKGVLTGKSEAVFDGLVKVAKGAQKTDARQDNRNLLLSKRALAHSNPRLEIYADDVKCSHGSSIGELDQEALFYLRSRGIGPEEAQGLLTYAFMGEVLDAARIEALREYERAAAFRHLPGGQTVKELP